MSEYKATVVECKVCGVARLELPDISGECEVCDYAAGLKADLARVTAERDAFKAMWDQEVLDPVEAAGLVIQERAAQIAALTKERDEYAALMEKAHDGCRKENERLSKEVSEKIYDKSILRAERDALKADNAKLRDVLHELVAGYDEDDGYGDAFVARIEDARLFSESLSPGADLLAELERLRRYEHGIDIANDTNRRLIATNAALIAAARKAREALGVALNRATSWRHAAQCERIALSALDAVLPKETPDE